MDTVYIHCDKDLASSSNADEVSSNSVCYGEIPQTLEFMQGLEVA